MPRKSAYLQATLASICNRNAVNVVKQEVHEVDATLADIIFKELWSDEIVAKASMRRARCFPSNKHILASCSMCSMLPCPCWPAAVVGRCSVNVS